MSGTGKRTRAKGAASILPDVTAGPVPLNPSTEAIVKAYMSRKDEYASDPLRSPVSNLKPDMFPSDMAWVVAQSMSEARAILAETEPEGNGYSGWWYQVPLDMLARGIDPNPLNAGTKVLAEALSAFVNE